MLPKTSAAHCMDDKLIAFLVTCVAETNMNNSPVFFVPYQANALLFCQKHRKNVANWMSGITQIATNCVLKIRHK